MGVLLSISVHCGRILHCEGTPTMREYLHRYEGGLWVLYSLSLFLSSQCFTYNTDFYPLNVCPVLTDTQNYSHNVTLYP